MNLALSFDGYDTDDALFSSDHEDDEYWATAEPHPDPSDLDDGWELGPLDSDTDKWYDINYDANNFYLASRGV